MARPRTNLYTTDGEVTVLHLKDGIDVLIDTSDVERVKERAWFDNGNGYIASKNRSGKVYLHRYIMNAAQGYVVDHINFNPLDNRKANLRICEQSQNALYQRPRSNDKGVYLNRKTGKHYIHVTIGKKAHHCGTFESKSAAIAEYDRLAKTHYGEYACIPVR